MTMTNRVIFDIETNGFYQDCTTVHCIALKRIGVDEDVLLFDTKQNNIAQGLKILSDADCLIGHNIIEFDIPVLEKLHPEYTYTHNVLDTLNLSSIVHPLMPKHSLEAWGKELGFSKLNPMTGQEYTAEELKEKKKIKDNAWDVYTDEMGAYCKQDVRITELVLWRCNIEDIPEYVIELSNKFSWIISNQVRTGCLIDKTALEQLNEVILQDEATAEQNLKAMLPSFTDYSFKVVKRNNQSKGQKAGDIVCEEVITEFNLNSTFHWMRFLKEKYNFEPPMKRRKGKEEPTASLDDEVLNTLDYPEVKELLRYKVASKIRGMIYSKPNSIYNLLDSNSVIHGKVATDGTVSGRCTHNNPNLATMPSVQKDSSGNIITGICGKYASEVRSLFIPRPGYIFVGFDAQALEVRCLAHNINDPEFIDQIYNGDIHTWTQKKAGLHTRKQAKTFMYAFLYGAGKQKLAEALSAGSDTKYTTQTVTKVINNFKEALPGLQLLLDKLQDEYAEYHGIIGLDGRLLQARSDYILLNLLCQSQGAIIMKQCLVSLNDELIKAGLQINKDYTFLLNIHDEVQAEVRPEHLETYKVCVQRAVDKTNEILKLNCKLEIDLKVGRSWAECH